ncbi:MAG TPA: ATP-binding protein [Chloroflexota bacterium]|nr:ATP-binding protein [Chloroflexota bacterium]
MDDRVQSPGAAGVLTGDGEMAALMRALPWSATPIGPVESWPQSLRTAVSICLASRFPMLLWWGPELVMLYNDAYRVILGTTKHPGALGRRGQECWPEIWDIIGPMLQGVLDRGEATYSEDQLLLLDRNGYVEECYFTFSYSPIRDETGGVGGVFTAVTETTGHVLGERRLATLHELAARAAEARTAENACAVVAATLAGNQADVPFAFLYLLDADGKTARLAGVSGLRGDAPAALSRIDLTAEDSPLGRVARTNTAEVIDNTAAYFGRLSIASEPSPISALVLPVAQAGQERAAGLLVAGISPRHALDTDYQRFFTLVAGQIATALADARAYEEERKRAEALAELDRAKTAFFSNVSHEFRTPLTLALGPVEDVLIGAGDVLPAPDRERLEIAHRNHLRLLKLVNTLLDFARIEAGRAQASYEPTDLALFTTDLASVFRSAVERAGLRLIVDCPTLPEPVYVDRDMWEKIVLNLLSNALKYTFEGEIAVGLRAAGDRVTLEVRDTGTGIPAGELPHLFERFHRIRGARARTHEGTGIGLALVREMTRLHGGTILVASTLGEGSMFTVTLPTGTAHLPDHQLGLARAEPLRLGNAAPYVEEAWRWLPEREGDEQGPPSIGPLVVDSQPALDPTARILLADDNADMRAYVGRLLGARYTVEAVADGATALASARERPPDLVLTDIMMPGLDGFGLLRELRADPRTASIPVILLSARAGEEARLEGLEAGADDYLVKPFSARELTATVGAHVTLARARALVTRLHHLTVALSAAITSDQVADVVITHGVGTLAATAGVVWLLSADGASLITVRGTGYPPDATAAWLSVPVSAPLPIADAVRARAPVILGSRAERDACYPQLADQWARSDDGALVAIPLLLGDRVVGGLGLGWATARHFDAEEQAAMRAMGELCAQALERARLHEAERTARAEAEGGRQRLSEIFQQAPAMIAVLLGPEHVFTVANLLYQQGVERDSDALLGRSVREVFPELEGQGIIERLDGVYRTGIPYVDNEMLIRLSRSDGRLEDIYFTFTYLPLRDAAGMVEGILVHAVDVTSQVLALRRTEEFARLVRAERDRLRQVLDTLPAAVVIAELSGRFTMSNVAATAMFGSGLDDHSLPRGDLEAFETYGACRLDGTPYPANELPLQRALWRGEVVRGEQLLIRMAATGRETPVLANTAPLHGPDGGIVGAVGIFQDITPIRDLERAREEFLSSAAHDLKNPLTSIRGQAQLAQRRLARLDNPQTAPVLGQLIHIQDGTDTMLGLINELVDVARQQMGGGIDLNREPTELVALVEGCVEAQRDASGRPIHLETDLSELHALVDAARITRVVGNLLSNALKYSPADSAIWLRIAIEAGAAGPEAVLVVRDEGMGIPAADLPYIFDRFQRAHNVVGHVQGTGVGLASARGIVEQHGGTITGESIEGSGATFTVRLPLEAP